MSSGIVHVSPRRTVDVTGGSETKPGTITSTNTCYPGRLTEPDTGSIGNGVKLMTANYGDSNTGEGSVWQIDIQALHPQSNTPFDKTTAYSTNDPVNLVKHKEGNLYWLPGSSLTVSVQDILVPAGSGLVKKALAHTASAKSVHTWTVRKAASAQSWALGEYNKFKQYYTANS